MLEIDYICNFFHNWVFTTPLHHFNFFFSNSIMNTIKDQNHGCYYKNPPKTFVCFNCPPTFVTKVKIFIYLKFHFFGIIFLYNLFIVWSYREIHEISTIGCHTSHCMGLHSGVCLWHYIPLKPTSSMYTRGTCKLFILCPMIISITTTIGECEQNTIHYTFIVKENYHCFHLEELKAMNIIGPNKASHCTIGALCLTNPWIGKR